MSQTYSPPAPPTSRVNVFLLGVWAVLSLAALVYVYSFGRNGPIIDEWEFVPVLVGKEPAGPWLWALHNEHRLPLPKAVWVTGFRLTHDFRTGMFLQVVVLSAMSLGLMRFAARLRGRPDWPDVFFPVSLLHLGHWENFTLGYQICFVLYCVLVTGLAVVAVRATRETAFRSGVLAGVLLLLTAMTGGAGLALVPPVALWLVYLAAVEWRGGGKGRAAVLVGLALLSVAYIGLYFANYARPPGHPAPSRDPVAIGVVAGEVLAMALGIGVAGAWGPVAAAELVLGIATVGLLVKRGKDPAERPSSAGLVAVAAGVAGVAVAIGLGRAGAGSDMGLWSRYALLTWPLLGAAYLAWVKAGGPLPAGPRKWVPMLLCVAAALAFPSNTGTGIVVGAVAGARNAAMTADARAGLSPEAIVRRNFPNSRDAYQDDRGVAYIPLLREANIGIFGRDGSGDSSLWWVAGVLGGVVLVGFGGRWFWHLCRAVQAERARELFRLQHERYEEQVVKVAGATGLPRGLRWVKCLITGHAVLVRDAATGGILALVPVTIEFEPEAGSDMEDVPAAREPRPATAVFAFANGTWETAGRVVFNHTPDQTVAKFAPQFRVIPHGHH